MNIRQFGVKLANLITPSPRGGIGVGVVLLLIFFVSCSSEEETYDPYHDWQVRNESWFRSVADSARTAIAEAKEQHGDDWDKDGNCQWRMFKRLDQAQNYNTGKLEDSICVRIIKNGTGDYSPTLSDSVRISFRGWLMPNRNNVQVDSLMQDVFTQTYFNQFNEETAAPQLSSVSPFVQGFSTALQYMVSGDDWMVYIPQQLAYGANVNGNIPAYSTLQFQIHMAAVYPCNSGVPTWKSRRK